MLALLAFTAACGGRRPAEAEQHELYRAIQESEAEQDREASRAASPYVSPLDTARAICEAADRACKAAKRSREADAKARCLRSRERCDAAMSAATGG